MPATDAGCEHSSTRLLPGTSVRSDQGSSGSLCRRHDRIVRPSLDRCVAVLVAEGERLTLIRRRPPVEHD
jgi:hypothetical protein